MAAVLTLISASGAAAIVEGGCVIDPCSEDEMARVKIEIPQPREGFLSMDCYTLMVAGRLRQYRYIPATRRMRAMSEVVGSGDNVSEPARSTPAPTPPPALTIPVSLEGASLIAADDDGRTLYVAVSEPTTLLRFERDPDSGHLALSDTRVFPSEIERDISLVVMRQRWNNDWRQRRERLEQAAKKQLEESGL